MMHWDLLDQAEQLAALDPKKPRQANLRRAISAAYYALFHSLVHEACCQQMGAQHDQAAFRRVLARAFAHTTMKRACQTFGGGTLKPAIRQRLPSNVVIPPPIRDLAQLFAELQEKRHLADYDLSERFQRTEVQTVLRTLRQRMTAFEHLPPSNEKRFFLACLWAWKDLDGR